MLQLVQEIVLQYMQQYELYKWKSKKRLRYPPFPLVSVFNITFYANSIR